MNPKLKTKSPWLLFLLLVLTTAILIGIDSEDMVDISGKSVVAQTGNIYQEDYESGTWPDNNCDTNEDTQLINGYRYASYGCWPRLFNWCRSTEQANSGSHSVKLVFTVGDGEVTPRIVLAEGEFSEYWMRCYFYIPSGYNPSKALKFYNTRRSGQTAGFITGTPTNDDGDMIFRFNVSGPSGREYPEGSGFTGYFYMVDVDNNNIIITQGVWHYMEVHCICTGDEFTGTLEIFYDDDTTPIYIRSGGTATNGTGTVISCSLTDWNHATDYRDLFTFLLNHSGYETEPGDYQYIYFDDIRIADTKGGLVTLEPSIKGDLNNDGQVNLQDYQACINHLLGRENWGEAADVNQDGSVNILDIQEIVNIILG